MLLGLQNVTFEFGARVIVEDATWHIQPNERIGLIGYNGTGKSTLLKVFTGQYLPSAGTIEKSRDTTIGFLHQDLLSFDTDDSILQVALGAFEDVLKLEKEFNLFRDTKFAYVLSSEFMSRKQKSSSCVNAKKTNNPFTDSELG